MGNEHSRAKHAKGYLAVQTEKPFYSPGEMVNGTIYLRTSAPIQARHIEIRVKGIEKTKWIDFVYNRKEDGTMEREPVKRASSKKIIEFSAPAFTFTTPELNPGDYTIPFAFQLPKSLPSSILFKKDTEAKTKAKVKYVCKTLLHAV